MGKKQHQSDKLYITNTEWREFYGGKNTTRTDSKDTSDFRRLPLDHCALSLQPYDAPYMDDEGNIFDLVHIVPYIKKYKRNPVTGKKLEPSQLVKLNIHKNSKGEMHCPVMFKVFTNTVHVAAIRTTGNVFCYEAISELNIKTKNFKDLLNSEPFTRKDIVVLQDPQDTSKNNLNSFHHLKNNFKVHDEDLERAKTDPKARLKHVNAETRQVLDQMEKTAEAERKEELKKAKQEAAVKAAEEAKAALEPAKPVKEPDEIRFSRVKKKGYVRLVTNLGVVNLELHTDIVPKTCETFINLCRKGYYNNMKFHRSIRHFMIQCGDPEGGSKEPDPGFKDELVGRLHHEGRGVLSMICGPNTNKTQFFLTYRSCKHLDGKHSVFGRVVGGAETTLSAMERVGTDNKDRPVEDIVIEKAQVFVDPFEEVDEQLAVERQKEMAEAKKQEDILKGKRQLEPPKKAYTSGVGKFISPSLKKEAKKSEPGASSSGPPKNKKFKSSTNFSNFDAW